jgi:hypothetical protein
MATLRAKLVGTYIYINCRFHRLQDATAICLMDVRRERSVWPYLTGTDWSTFRSSGTFGAYSVCCGRLGKTSRANLNSRTDFEDIFVTLVKEQVHKRDD